MSNQIEINHTKTEATEAIKTVREFMPQSELSVIADNCRGEEKQFFFNMLVNLEERIKNMPVTYQQDGLKDQAIAYLHYFRGNMDWFITEKDIGSQDEPGQRQAFGLADLGEGFPEMGYISIVELIGAGVELDLYFEPKTLAEIKSEREENGKEFKGDDKTEQFNKNVIGLDEKTALSLAKICAKYCACDGFCESCKDEAIRFQE